MRCGLEVELQCQLEVAIRPRRAGYASNAIRAGRGVLYVIIGLREARMVEGIKGFESELHILRFPDRERFA